MSSEEFKVEDFKLKLGYLISQYDRLWQRFNFFLSVEMALFGFFGYLAFEKGNIPATRLATWLGIFVSLIWFITSAQDRALVDVYRNRVKIAADEISKQQSLSVSDYGTNHVGVEVPSHFNNILSWYWRPISVTRIPVYTALIHILVWSCLLAYGVALLRSLT